ncbi:hypothetical protein MMC25_003646 [Agyrium rufum]|nr:hypothetical protein [Agyrium rufum]
MGSDKVMGQRMTYGKSPRNPARGLTSAFSYLDHEESSHLIPAIVRDPRVASHPEAPSKSGFVSSQRLDTKAYLKSSLPAKDNRDIYDFPSSGDEANTEHITFAYQKYKKPKIGKAQTLEDAVYDDASLQRHIEMETSLLKTKEQRPCQAQPGRKQHKSLDMEKAVLTKSIGHRTQSAQDLNPKAGSQAVPRVDASFFASRSTSSGEVGSSQVDEDVLLITPPPALSRRIARHAPSKSHQEQIPNPKTSITNSTKVAKPTSRNLPSLKTTETPDISQGWSSKLSSVSSSTKIGAFVRSTTSSQPIAKLTHIQDPSPNLPSKFIKSANEQSTSSVSLQKTVFSLESMPEKSKTLTLRPFETFGTLPDTRESPRRKIVDRLGKKSSTPSSSSADEIADNDDYADSTLDSPGNRHAHNMLRDRASSTLSIDRASEESTNVVSEIATLIARPALPNGGPSITYNQQRSYLSEQHVEETALFSIPLITKTQPRSTIRRVRARPEAVVKNAVDTIAHEKETFGNDITGMRSIHELREAGGASRYLGEILSLLDDIDISKNPTTSLRRSALLDLAKKLIDTSFCDVFMSHDFLDRLIPHLTDTQDEVVVSLLLVCMELGLRSRCSTSSLTLVNNVEVFGVLSSYIRLDKELRFVVKERKLNISRATQSELVTLYGTLLDLLLLPKERRVKLSIRFLSLQCLERILGHLANTELTFHGFSSNLVQVILNFVGSVQTPQLDIVDPATLISDRERSLGLSILEYTATENLTRNLADGLWTRQSLDDISSLLIASSSALGNSNDSGIRLSFFRLCLNLTNNNTKACEVLGSSIVMNTIITVIVAGFGDLQNRNCMAPQGQCLLDELVLALGLLTNIAEFSGAAAANIILPGKGHSSGLDILVGLFTSRLAGTEEATSEQDIQANIIFGYLSVLLAQLALDSRARSLMRLRLQPHGLGLLKGALDEFLLLNERAADQMQQQKEPGEMRSKSGLNDRLQTLSEGLRTIVITNGDEIRD